MKVYLGSDFAETGANRFRNLANLFTVFVEYIWA